MRASVRCVYENNIILFVPFQHHFEVGMNDFVISFDIFQVSVDYVDGFLVVVTENDAVRTARKTFDSERAAARK